MPFVDERGVVTTIEVFEPLRLVVKLPGGPTQFEDYYAEETYMLEEVVWAHRPRQGGFRRVYVKGYRHYNLSQDEFTKSMVDFYQLRP